MSDAPKLVLPKHIGFILDGNRRWAKEQNLPTLKGHYEGAEVLKKTAIMAVRGGIQYISAFLFSTENWNRSKTEINYLMKLIVRFAERNIDELIEEDIRLIHIGARDGLPKNVLSAIDKAVKASAHCEKGVLALCINYGGQQEIVDAAKKLLRHQTDPNRLSVREFEQYLYSSELPPVDLVVRTSGEYRTSGFMMWQAAYAEYVFLEKYWPDFNRNDLKSVLLYYAKRQRRYGA